MLRVFGSYLHHWLAVVWLEKKILEWTLTSSDRQYVFLYAGKTHVGLKIAQALLENAEAWSRRTPMLVVCYTNHALDQFLEGDLPGNETICTNKALMFSDYSLIPKAL